MPAIVARRYNPVAREFADRLKKAGKPNRVIIGAVMRKLLHIIYGVLKSGKPFDPEWSTNNSLTGKTVSLNMEPARKTYAEYQ